MSAERKALEKQRNEYNELKRQFDKCPLARREALQEQLSRVSVSTTLSCIFAQRLRTVSSAKSNMGRGLSFGSLPAPCLSTKLLFSFPAAVLLRLHL